MTSRHTHTSEAERANNIAVNQARGNATLLVQDTTRRGPIFPSRHLREHELDALMAVYAVGDAFIPQGDASLDMYRTVRVLHIRGLVAMEPEGLPGASPRNPHSSPTRYTWRVRLTRKGQGRVAVEMARGLPVQGPRPYRSGATA
jgi:hypothetical protein